MVEMHVEMCVTYGMQFLARIEIHERILLRLVVFEVN